MNLLFDSYAFLELLNPSSKADKVKQLIGSADQLYTTVLNLYEVKYRVTQRASSSVAEDFFSSIKTTVHVLVIDEDLSSAAADLKLQHPKLGAVDCHALAAARKNDLVLVTGDSDFPKSDKIIQL
ncbi:PIN domain-containing protein [Candidatus Micrarchaeota archaeon]|nr:PIN domain-containing protein [Candidatus Micrarchaeota archaeon]